MRSSCAFSPHLILVSLFLLFYSAFLNANFLISRSRLQAAQTAAQFDGREALSKGVEAFRNGQIEEAEQFFARAKELDPQSVNARLYLATAYASQYIPGAPADENTKLAHQAVDEFKQVLALDASNISAIDGIGSLLFQMAGQPFSPKLFEESKDYHRRHIQLQPADPEPYYWIGVIDWTLAFRANGELRAHFNNDVATLDAAAPLPPQLREQYSQQYGATIQEGIDCMIQAIKLRPDYDDAMAYLNLLYRRQADVTGDEGEREKLIQAADDLVDKVKEIKEARAKAPGKN